MRKYQVGQHAYINHNGDPIVCRISSFPFWGDGKNYFVRPTSKKQNPACIEVQEDKLHDTFNAAFFERLK